MHAMSPTKGQLAGEGGVLSTTVTTNAHWSMLPDPSEATSITVVSPISNSEPAKLLVYPTSLLLSVKFTGASSKLPAGTVPALEGASASCVGGHVIFGGCWSSTKIAKVHSACRRESLREGERPTQHAQIYVNTHTHTHTHTHTP
jgi:hypothetical protein